MSFWTPDQLQRITAGRWLVKPADPQRPLQGLGIDSRAVRAGQVFLAIKGERFDGHDFVDAALAAGAGLAIVSRAGAERSCEAASGVLLVDDTLAALHVIAAAWRDRLAESDVKVIAVAGSNGKTTTRHLIHTVLSSKLRGTQSPKSFNNHIGVPLTLLGASLDDDFVVAELGTNHPGEIETLARIVRPDAAVITSIGEEHLEFFGSVRGVAEEEATLFGFLRPGGKAYVSEQAAEFLGAKPQPAVVYGGGVFEVGRPDGSLRLGSCSFTFGLPGRHNVENAAGAVCVGRWIGLDDAAIAGALASAESAPMRSQLLRLGDAGDPSNQLLLLHDAYNANPQSMRAALNMLADLSPPASHGRRIAILGDMLELGAEGPQLHRAIGEEWNERIDLCVTIGSLAARIAEPLPPDAVHRFPAWSDELPQRIAALIQPGDAVLLKASRGMKLERLIPAIEQRIAAGNLAPTHSSV